jgi:hypothetical protein
MEFSGVTPPNWALMMLALAVLPRVPGSAAVPQNFLPWATNLEFKLVPVDGFAVVVPVGAVVPPEPGRHCE